MAAQGIHRVQRLAVQVGNGFDVQPGVRDDIGHVRAAVAAVHHRQLDDPALQR
ncbi:hypothetical protein APX70_200113 [Pseudomonas syringae pv. maculicola]|uniref:Uncharacterized protein n=1 Tax=Pseudomonas syringae pv. maculicola TaxID=59511 RepID=A0A3M2ZHZ2_PSEYM|nr:hypothetical protein APX70_200113 [Pseudomonas syringae pv. maculicola]